MAETDCHCLDFSCDISDIWDEIASRSAVWALERSISLRDAVLLLPLAHHLTPARLAFGRRGGWIPRIETVRTLVASCPPVSKPVAEALSFDIAEDRLRAEAMLDEQDWARQWMRRDRRGFDEAVGRLVGSAHRLAHRLCGIAPAERDDWLLHARGLLDAPGDPAATERVLARAALEWAAASGPFATDPLFDIRPSGWILVQAGGKDLIGDGILGAAGDVPCLVLQADRPDSDPLPACAASTKVSEAVCADFEDEAEACAAQLLGLLSAGMQPVALIALDRLLVRRVGALLARRQVPVLDETGWKLSTTRAAAGVMALLRAASKQATTDELLDWLKSLPHGHAGVPIGTALDALEGTLRKSGWARVDALRLAPMEGAAARTRDWAVPLLQALGEGGRMTLAQWTERLRHALQSSGQWESLLEDAAGRQVVRVLRLVASFESMPSKLTLTIELPFLEFVRIVDTMLEHATYDPPPPVRPPVVVITPLRRALLRPFAAAVLPGSDERRLGMLSAPDPLLGDSLAAALGMPSVSEQQRDEAQALSHLLRLPEVVLLRRRQEMGELLAPSLLLERLRLMRERAGAPLVAARELRERRVVSMRAQPRPAPVATGALPASLSASTVEALRDCPYRFFARAVLRLREPDELEDEAAKRDYGNWLHEVLLRFHEQRAAPGALDAEAEQLRRLAAEQREAHGIDPDSFLPFEASFERFVGHYLKWLHERDAAGARWLEGESERRAPMPEIEGVELQGRIDRIDDVRADGRMVRELIDYKTVPLPALRERVRDPLEDTQLAFYAALELLRDDPPPALVAAYLALDEGQGVTVVRHEEVEDSARQLLQGLGDELRRMRAGAPLPALGEGRVCEFCEARGLCRRDHWDDNECATGA
ncbi:MAG TPA: PD-(D/E)XK nuclease family protein [Burkholderiaceae bacterium]|nr:PD-(D/E)XK nuclease family protein [Burkholderiaceae bacterium]